MTSIVISTYGITQIIILLRNQFTKIINNKKSKENLSHIISQDLLNTN